MEGGDRQIHKKGRGDLDRTYLMGRKKGRTMQTMGVAIKSSSNDTLMRMPTGILGKRRKFLKGGGTAGCRE